ncbi:hypothetical protein ACFX2I_044851 [Malus domestica]
MDTSSSAHGAGVAASSSSSQSSNRWKYEVFLSFRGEDTRNTFTDDLFIAFRKAGINTSVDYQLRRGGNIQSELDRQIEGVKNRRHRLLEEVRGVPVVPEGAVEDHESVPYSTTLTLLKASADLVGWDLKNTADGREGVFIEKIVEDIKGLLKTTDLKKAKHSDEMAFRVLEFSTEYLGVGGLSNSLLLRKANYCTALEIMSDFSEMSKMRVLELKDCRKVKDIPNLDNSLDHMCSILMKGCTSLTDTFKENLRTKNAFGGIFLSGNDIPNWLVYVAGEDKTVKFEVPTSIDYIGGLALGIVYSFDNSDSTGSQCIDVVNYTQRTKFRIWPMKATVTASHEYYFWLGNLSNKKLNLKGGDIVHVKAEFYGGDNRIKVNKTGVDMVKWDLSDGLANWDNYKTMPYESDEDTDDDTQLDIRHVFLCYKTPEAWPWCINDSESDPLPKFFTSALKACKNDITFKTLMTIIEGHEGTDFSNGNVFIFPQMIKYRGLKESDLDSFVDDVLVNRKPWASGVQEPLTSPYVFICARMSQNGWNRNHARSLIDEFKQEAELQGLTDHVFVTACFHIGGHMYPGNLIIFSIGSDGSMTSHWDPFATPGDVSKLLDEHIGKGEIIERHWRGQIRASSDEVEEINDRKLPNGEENKKIEDKPQENSNQIHQEKGNQIENSENGEIEEKQLKETRESKS